MIRYLSIFLAFAVIAVAASASEESREELIAREKRQIQDSEREAILTRHTVASSDVPKGWTLLGFLTLKWNMPSENGLPEAVLIRNPFLEKFTIRGRGPDPKLGISAQLTDSRIAAQVFMEFYDPVLKQWRQPGKFTGTLGNTGEFDILYGSQTEIKLGKSFWQFALDTMPQLSLLPDRVDIRVAYDAGGVILRSEPFIWSVPSKPRHVQPRPATTPK